MSREASARSRSDERRVDDEEIFTILRAGEAEGVNTAELCASHGVTVPVYCLWKARYRHLSLPELCTLRRQERQRALIRRGSVVAVLTLVAAGAGLFMASGGTAEPVPANAARALPSVPSRAAGSAPSAAAPRNAATPSASPPANPSPGDRMVAPSTADGGFHVQVSAEPDVQLARETVERLVSSGYPAYVLPTMVDDLELYRVRIGPFESRQDAQQILGRLEREGYEGPWIAK